MVSVLPAGGSLNLPVLSSAAVAPLPGGALLYPKADGALYLRDENGETRIGPNTGVSPVFYAATVTTDSSGSGTVTFPAGKFTTTPLVFATVMQSSTTEATTVEVVSRSATQAVVKTSRYRDVALPIVLSTLCGYNVDTHTPVSAVVEVLAVDPNALPQNYKGDKGLPGDPGAPALVSVAGVNTVNPAAAPTVTDQNGSASIAELLFGLPRAARFTLGTVTTLPAGSEATMQLLETTDGDYTMNVGLPVGAGGQPGADGEPGANGVSAVVNVLQPVTVSPVAGPSVTDTNPDPTVADLLFSLPRSRTLSVGTVSTLPPGEPATVTISADADGDYIADFGIPVGATGAAGESGGTGSVCFAEVHSDAGAPVVAETVADSFYIEGGPGVVTSSDTVNGIVTVTNTDRGSVAVTVHENQLDPHPQYLLEAEANSLYVGDQELADAVAGLHTDINTAISDHENAADPHPQYLTQTEGDARYATHAELQNGPVSAVEVTGDGLAASRTGGTVTLQNTGVTSVNGSTGAVTIPASYPFTFHKLAADQSNTANTAWVTVNDLVGSFPAWTMFQVEAWIKFASDSSSSGVRLQTTVTGGAEFFSETVVPNTNVSSNSIQPSTLYTPNEVTNGVYQTLGQATRASSLTAVHTMKVSGLLVVGAEAAGLSFAFQPEVNGATAKLFAGSILTLQQVA